MSLQVGVGGGGVLSNFPPPLVTTMFAVLTSGIYDNMR